MYEGKLAKFDNSNAATEHLRMVAKMQSNNPLFARYFSYMTDEFTRFLFENTSVSPEDLMRGTQQFFDKHEELREKRTSYWMS